MTSEMMNVCRSITNNKVMFLQLMKNTNAVVIYHLFKDFFCGFYQVLLFIRH